MRTIGLDVHKRFAEVAILEDDRAQPLRRRIDVTPAALGAFAATLGSDDQVVLESSTNTWAVAELLSAHAGRVVVSNPLRTRAIADAKVKTDKVDAETLARLLAADFIPQVWIPDRATLALRREVARRARLVRERTRLRNMVHAVLHRALVDAPHSDLFGQGGRSPPRRASTALTSPHVEREWTRPPQWGATVRVARPRCAAEHKPRTPLFSRRSGRVRGKA